MKNLKMKFARMEKNMTQADLADLLKVSRQTVCLIEIGKYRPSLDLCIKICKLLDKTLNDLFWED